MIDEPPRDFVSELLRRIDDRTRNIPINLDNMTSMLLLEEMILQI